MHWMCRLTSITRALLFVIATAIAVPTASAQQQPAQRQAGVRAPGAISVDEAIAITNGWALIADGLAERAAAKAAQVLAVNPRSGAALHLALEAEIVRGGAPAALDRYERWLGQRTVEEPAAMRRVAIAMLRESAASPRDPAVRLASLRALADDGDARAAAELTQVAAKGQGAEARALAALGDERAVAALLEELRTQGPGNPAMAIDALGDSGSKQAIAAIVDRLTDPRQEVRGAAVAALGKLGDAETAALIRPMLSDRSLHVRLRAAGALLRLDDFTGQPMLQEMMTDPSPAMRLDAVEALASRPDAGWLATVTALSQEPDPEIRAAAGRLLAPHNPEMAQTVLESLMSDENPAIRELASRGLADAIPDDLPSLRRLMRTGHPLTRVRAATRVLALTR